MMLDALPSAGDTCAENGRSWAGAFQWGWSSMCKGPEAGGLQVLEDEPEASGAGMEGVRGVGVGGSGAGISLGLVGYSEGWGSLSPGCKWEVTAMCPQV